MGVCLGWVLRIVVKSEARISHMMNLVEQTSQATSSAVSTNWDTVIWSGVVAAAVSGAVQLIVFWRSKTARHEAAMRSLLRKEYAKFYWFAIDHMTNTINQTNRIANVVDARKQMEHARTVDIARSDCESKYDAADKAVRNVNDLVYRSGRNLSLAYWRICLLDSSVQRRSRIAQLYKAAAPDLHGKGSVDNIAQLGPV